MNLLKFTTLLFVTLKLFTARAAVDPYNAYLWNRENVLAGNGREDQSDWYEWWYFKVVDPQKGEAFFFTYGVVNPWDVHQTSPGAKAILQFGDFKSHFLVNKLFPVSQFTASRDRVSVVISGNTATDQHLTGDLTSDDGHHIIWDLSWKQDWRFNAMGWSLRAPASGIYWYPAQASARASGWIRIDDRLVWLANAPAYQDRNWGSSFPKWWTWITSNHFDGSPGTALAVGGGEPELFGGLYLFQGLCIGLKYQGREYIFRSVDLMNNVDFDVHWGKWQVSAQNARGEAIEIRAEAGPEKFLDLPFQTPRGTVFHDYEALLGHVEVDLYRWSSPDNNWMKIASLASDEAGIEWGSPNAISAEGPAFHFSSGVAGDRRAE